MLSSHRRHCEENGRGKVVGSADDRSDGGCV